MAQPIDEYREKKPWHNHPNHLVSIDYSQGGNKLYLIVDGDASRPPFPEVTLPIYPGGPRPKLVWAGEKPLCEMKGALSSNVDYLLLCADGVYALVDGNGFIQWHNQNISTGGMFNMIQEYFGDAAVLEAIYLSACGAGTSVFDEMTAREVQFSMGVKKKVSSSDEKHPHSAPFPSERFVGHTRMIGPSHHESKAGENQETDAATND